MKLLVLATLTFVASMFVMIFADNSDEKAPIYDFTQLESFWLAFKTKFNKTYNYADEIYRLF